MYDVGRGSECVEFVDEDGDGGVDLAVVEADEVPRFFVEVAGEDDAVVTGQHSIEQGIAETRRAGSDAGPSTAAGVRGSAHLHREPQCRSSGEAVGECRAEGSVEQCCADLGEFWLVADRRGERGGELRSAILCRRPQRSDVGMVEQPERLDEAGVDLGFGDRVCRRVEDRFAEVRRRCWGTRS